MSLVPPPNPRWPQLQIAPAVNAVAWMVGRVAAAICLLSVVPLNDPQLAAGQRFTFVVAVGAACLPIADRATARRVGPAIIAVIAFFVAFGDSTGNSARQLEAATGHLLLVTSALSTLVVVWLGEALWDREAEHPRARVTALALGGLLLLGFSVAALGAQGELRDPVLDRADWQATAVLLLAAGLPLLPLTPWPHALGVLDDSLGRQAAAVRNRRLQALGVRDFGVCPRSEAAPPMIVGAYAGLFAVALQDDRAIGNDVYSYWAAAGALLGGALWLGLYVVGRRRRVGWSWRRRSGAPTLLVITIVLAPASLAGGVNDGHPVLGMVLAMLAVIPGAYAVKRAFPLR